MKKIITVLVVVMLLISGYLYYLLDKTNKRLDEAMKVTETVQTVVELQTVFIDLIESSSDKLVDVIYTMPSQIGNYTSSGFVYKTEHGKTYIITAEGNLPSSDKISVSFANGILLDAQLVGSDHYYDFALLSVETDFEVPTFEFKDSESLSQGEWILTIGSGLQTSLSGLSFVGIISSKDSLYSYSATEENARIYRVPVVQIGTSISRKVNGAPAISENGQVIGMVSSRLSSLMTDTGCSVVPMNEIATIANRFIAEEEIYYYDLGYDFIEVKELNSYQKNYYGLTLDQFSGLYISSLNGITDFDVEVGDILVSINDTEINSVHQLKSYLLQNDIENCTLTVIRPSAGYTTYQLGMNAKVEEVPENEND